MRSNQALGDFVNYWTDTLREYAYVFTIFGEPSVETPWMWQIMGHHLDLHCTVLGDRLVFAPQFMATEMAEIDDGPYAGRKLFDAQEQRALELAGSLIARAARARRALSLDALARPARGARPADRRPPPRGRRADNLVLAVRGRARRRAVRRAARGAHGARRQLPHALARRAIASSSARRSRRTSTRPGSRGIGGYDDEAPFYYRVHSPVILIEFDHHPGVVFDNEVPTRHHVHTLVRTPNGGDYGMELVRARGAAG